MSTLGTLVGLLALAVNLIVALRRPASGVALYVILAMLAPTVTVAGWPVAYELYALLPILGVALARRPRLRYARLHVGLGAFLALLVFSTIVGTTSYGTDVDMVRLQGVARFLVLFGIMAEFLDRDAVERVLAVVVGANALAAVVQMFVPGTAGIFYSLYGRAGQAALQGYALEDLIPRASGTFNSPVELGTVALLGVAVAWAGMVSGDARRRHRWLLLLSGLAGMLSLTKTFILGAPLVIAGGFALAPLTGGSKPFHLRPRTAALMAVATIGTAFAVVVAARSLSAAGFGVQHYVGYLLNPAEAFSTRYGTGGLLAGTMEVVRDNPVFGVGVTRVRGEFLGDSAYLWLLHSTGALGAALAAVGLLLLLHRIVAAPARVAGRARISLLVLAALLMAGAAFPIVPSLGGALGIVYLLSSTEAAAAVTGRRAVRARVWSDEAWRT